MFGLGSSSQLGIGIAIKLHDQFSAKAAQVNQQLLAMKKNSMSAVTGAMTDYRNQSAGIALGAAGASIAMVSAAKQGAEFQHAINQVYIVGGKSIGKTRAQLSEFATNLSKEFNRTPLEISQAMFENVKAGVTTGLDEITKYQIAAATATDEALGGAGGVAQNLLAIMNAMDLPISKFKEIANATTTAANASMASVYDIGESMQYAAFTAHQFNIPLEQSLALIAKLSQSNIRGTSAGTGINNMLTQLAKTLGPNASKKSKANWAMTGMDMNQVMAMANSGDIFGIIEGLEKSTKNMSPLNRKGILGALFNMRGDKALEGMFSSKNGNKTLEDFLREIKQGVKGDTAMAQSKAMMDDIHSEFMFLRNAVARFKIAFVEAAGPTIKVLLKMGTAVMGVVNSIMGSGLGNVLAALAVVVVPTIGVIFAFRAAVMTAILSLRAMSALSGVGGFRGLAGSGLGMLGTQGMANAGMKSSIVNGLRNGTVVRNAAGSLTQGGKILVPAYKAAQYAGIGAGGASLATRGVSLLGGIGGLLGRAIPILGGILLGVEVLKALGMRTEAEHEKRVNDPMINAYYRNLDEAYLGYSLTNRDYNRIGGSRSDQVINGRSTNPTMNQQININIDGQMGLSKSLSQKMDETLLRGMNLNFPL